MAYNSSQLQETSLPETEDRIRVLEGILWILRSGAAIRVGRRQHAGRPRQKPLRVIADKGYDCDALRKRLRRRGIVLIAPLRLNRRRTPPQDGRVLRAALITFRRTNLAGQKR